MNGIEQIGRFVRERRRARRLTQADLAALAGVTRALIIDIEHGKSTLRIDSLERVLNVFGKTLGPVDLRAEASMEVSL